MTTPFQRFDPLALARHRVHVSTSDSGFEASCATCGWRTVAASREERQTAVDAHHAIPRSRGLHGLVSEGD
jgi:hypothetical protein